MMKSGLYGMTTRDAFEYLINQAGAAELLGVQDTQIRSLRKNLKKGLVKVDKMEEILKKGGFEVQQEKTWFLVR